MEKFHVFTEIVGCGKIAKICLDSFHKYHNLKVHVYGTTKDFQHIIPNDNNILINIENEKSIMDEYLKTHFGMFLLWEKILLETQSSHIIHFDSDVVFRGNVIDDMIQKADEGYDLIGPRRRYRGFDTVCPTTLICFNKDKLPKYEKDKMVRFFIGLINPDGLHNVDFFDVPMYTIIKNGGKVYHLDFNDVGGVDENGGRNNSYGNLNHLLEVGKKISHFCGACSGMDLYNDPVLYKKSNAGYADFAISSYVIFCKIFYDEDLKVKIDSKYNEMIKIKKEEWY